MQGFCKTPILRHNILTLPPQVTNLVLAQSPGTITGSFNGVAAQYTQPISYLVVYKAGGIPNLPTDGNSISITANGSPIYSFNIPGLSNGTSYGVRIFVLGNFGFQTSQEAQGTITPVAGIALSSLADGVNPATIKLTEGGSGVNFLVLKHNYQSSERTLVLRNDLYDLRAWESAGTNAYANSDIDLWLNGDYLNLLDSNIRNQISAVTIPYTIGNGNKTLSTLSRKVFLLSYTEIGMSGSSYANVEGSALYYFNSNVRRIAYFANSSNKWWLRSPYTSGTSSAWFVSSNGVTSGDAIGFSYGSRPAFTLPANMLFQTTPNSDGSYSPI